MLTWVGLDLFNDDTGDISRPTHVNVSHGCFHYKLLMPDYTGQVLGLVHVNKLHQTGGDSSEELYRMSYRSYQKNPAAQHSDNIAHSIKKCS